MIEVTLSDFISKNPVRFWCNQVARRGGEASRTLAGAKGVRPALSGPSSRPAFIWDLGSKACQRTSPFPGLPGSSRRS